MNRRQPERDPEATFAAASAAQVHPPRLHDGTDRRFSVAGLGRL